MYMTQYTEFIKSWAHRNNKSYMCAATDPRAREEYYGAYPKRPTKSKLKQNREKQTAAVMGLMEMGAKAKESAAAKDAAPPERNSDRARAREALTNPAAGVLTNPDLVRVIGSFIPKIKNYREHYGLTKQEAKDIFYYVKYDDYMPRDEQESVAFRNQYDKKWNRDIKKAEKQLEKIVKKFKTGRVAILKNIRSDDDVTNYKDPFNMAEGKKFDNIKYK